jgi:hypothetical protein
MGFLFKSFHEVHLAFNDKETSSKIVWKKTFHSSFSIWGSLSWGGSDSIHRTQIAVDQCKAQNGSHASSRKTNRWKTVDTWKEFLISRMTSPLFLFPILFHTWRRVSLRSKFNRENNSKHGHFNSPKHPPKR